MEPIVAPAAESYPFILRLLCSYLSPIYPPIISLGIAPKIRMKK
jgi:hypothetical protein